MKAMTLLQRSEKALRAVGVRPGVHGGEDPQGQDAAAKRLREVGSLKGALGKSLEDLEDDDAKYRLMEQVCVAPRPPPQRLCDSWLQPRCALAQRWTADGILSASVPQLRMIGNTGAPNDSIDGESMAWESAAAREKAESASLARARPRPLAAARRARSHDARPAPQPHPPLTDPEHAGGRRPARSGRERVGALPGPQQEGALAPVRPPLPALEGSRRRCAPRLGARPLGPVRGPCRRAHTRGRGCAPRSCFCTRRCLPAGRCARPAEALRPSGPEGSPWRAGAAQATPTGCASCSRGGRRTSTTGSRRCGTGVPPAPRCTEIVLRLRRPGRRVRPRRALTARVAPLRAAQHAAARGGRAPERRAGDGTGAGGGRGLRPPPSLPYKVDTPRPSLRTNWTHLRGGGRGLRPACGRGSRRGGGAARRSWARGTSTCRRRSTSPPSMGGARPCAPLRAVGARQALRDADGGTRRVRLVRGEGCGVST